MASGFRGIFSGTQTEQLKIVAEKRPFLTCDKLSTVDSEIDFTKHTEPELVDMFERLDPRYAPTECARIANFLTERGYIVTDGTTGPGIRSAIASKA